MRQFRDTHYSVDTDGNVYSKGAVLKPFDNNGYKRIKLNIEGIRRAYLVHRLVAEAYLGASDLCVDHIDNNKANNNLSNLQYLTVAENINKERKYKELPMYVTKFLRPDNNKMNYRYVRRIDNKNEVLYCSQTLGKVLRFKLNYERLWNV